MLSFRIFIKMIIFFNNKNLNLLFLLLYLNLRLEIDIFLDYDLIVYLEFYKERVFILIYKIYNSLCFKKYMNLKNN